MSVVIALSRSFTRGATGPALAAAIAGVWLAIHFGGIFAFPLTSASVVWVLPLIAMQTWLSTGLFIVAHDAMHGSFVPGNAGANRWAGRVALMLYAGIDYDRLLPKHIAHHRHAGTAADPDFDARNPTRALRWLGRFVARYYSHWQIVRIAAVIGGYVLAGAPLANIAVFWAAPALLALVQLFWFGTYLPHRHAEGFADRHNARSSAFGPWLSVVTCFNFGGYHHEHHLHPHVPWWRLPVTRSEGSA